MYVGGVGERGRGRGGCGEGDVHISTHPCMILYY